jgi:hypothetical protein
MRRFLPLALACGAAVVLGLAAGCGSTAKDDEDDEGGGGKPKVPKETKALKPVEAGEGTTLKGKVTFKGSKPDLAALTEKFHQKIKEIKADQYDICVNVPPSESEQAQQQDWRIADDGGVENVVVWLRPQKGEYFKVDTSKPWWRDQVVLDQPHCTFTPRVDWVFAGLPEPTNPRKFKPNETQKFYVQNSATISHNTKFDSGSAGPNKNDLSIIPGVAKGAKPEPKLVELKPYYNGPVHFVCNIHGWMEADVWALDHPFAAVTDKNGNYEIHNVPKGAKVKVVAWHPKADFLTKGKSNGDDLQLEDKETALNFDLNWSGK